MSTRARTTEQVEAAAGSAIDGRPAWRRRLRALLHREEREDDGVFRPVLLPFWMDLGIAVGIIVFMAGSFGGFIYFLARTQGR